MVNPVNAFEINIKFPEKITDMNLDIVGLVAILGESSTIIYSKS